MLNHLANQFSESSNGVFFGPFGSLDGVAIRIRSPTLKEVPDPGNYYCRKGFYALNVQAICDKKKRFLWCYPSNKGSTHDSSAFSGSRLYDLLREEAVSKKLYEMGLFLAGETAYGVTSLSHHTTLMKLRETLMEQRTPSITTCLLAGSSLSVPSGS